MSKLAQFGKTVAIAALALGVVGAIAGLALGGLGVLAPLAGSLLNPAVAGTGLAAGGVAFATTMGGLYGAAAGAAIGAIKSGIDLMTGTGSQEELPQAPSAGIQKQGRSAGVTPSVAQDIEPPPIPAQDAGRGRGIG